MHPIKGEPYTSVEQPAECLPFRKDDHMERGKKILNIAGWTVIIITQALLGFFGGYIFSIVGYNTWLSTILSLWVGDTIGIFIIGAIVLAFRRSVQPKNYFMRFIACAFAALLPIGVLIILSYFAGYDSDLVQGGWGAMLTVLTVVTGILGFYIPNWIGSPQTDG